MMNRVRKYLHDSSPTIMLVLRVLIGLIFVLSGSSKLLRPSEYFEVAINMYQVFPEGLVHIMALVVPWIETVLGTYLILGYGINITAFILALFTVIFQLIIAQTFLREMDIIECGCFGGGAIHLTMFQSFMLDTFMLLALIEMTGDKSKRFSLDRLLLKNEK